MAATSNTPVVRDGKLYIGAISVRWPEPCANQAPLHENACVKVEGIKRLLMAAAKAEYFDEGFVEVCRDLGLLQYGEDIPSDVGILNWLQDLTDAVLHSRYYRQAVIEAKANLQGLIVEAESIKAAKEEEKRQTFVQKIEDKYASIG